MPINPYLHCKNVLEFEAAFRFMYSIGYKRTTLDDVDTAFARELEDFARHEDYYITAFIGIYRDTLGIGTFSNLAEMDQTYYSKCNSYGHFKIECIKMAKRYLSRKNQQIHPIPS